MSDEATSVSPEAKRLFLATRPFAEETPLRSWWYVTSTIVLLAAALAGAATLPWWPLQLAASVLGSLLFVRTFILYHDFNHNALLHGSWLAKGIFFVCGLVLLAPTRYWRFSHNYHHANVGRPVTPEKNSLPVLTSDVGSFPLMSTAMWKTASRWQRLRYRFIRHPLTILFAYATVFCIGLCLIPLVKNPRKYWDGGLAIVVHGGLIALLWIFAGFQVALFAVILPYGLAAAVGAYMFYAQHNFEGMRVVPSSEWSFYEGAIQSSGYMKLGRVLNWFTGNIAYHNVHHLNSRIPFYRLPEAMAGIPELQAVAVTTLRPSAIITCFRLNLWDVEKQRLVSYRDAA